MRKKSFFAFALIAVMLLGMLSACQTETAPADSGPLKVSDGFVPFEERVHITVPVYDRALEGFPPVDDNYWTKWVQREFGDKYNVEVEYVAIPRGDVLTKYNLLIAGGDTPTIMMEYDYPKVAEWATTGAMQPIDLNEFKKIAPNYYQAMVDNNQLGYTDMGGQTFFVLSERPYYNTTFTHATFVRMDWLEAVGFDHVPATYEEHEAAIAAIMEAGLTDIAPMGLTIPNDSYSRNFAFRDFPIDEAEWAMHSTLATASIPWEPTKEMLRRYNSEYNKGWYSTEFELDVPDQSGATTSSQRQADFVNGKTYSYSGYLSPNMPWLTAFYENNPDAKLAIENPNIGANYGETMTQIRADNPFGMIVGFSALASADQLKAAWMLMEWMIDPEVLFTLENGVEGVTYTIGENGLPVVNVGYRGEEMLNHNMNIDMTCLVHASKKVGTAEETIAAIAPQGLPQDFTEALINNYTILKEIAAAGRAYSDPVFAVSIPSEPEYSGTLTSLWKEDFVKLVKCAPEEFDSLYDELAAQYLAAGYQEIIDERLAAYEAGNTTKLPK